MKNLPELTELSDADLDAVAGGQSVAAGGLANVAVNVEDVQILNGSLNNIEIIDDVTVTIRDIAKHNNVGVGVLINALGGPSAILQRHTQ
jgi:hypothetical protein